MQILESNIQIICLYKHSISDTFDTDFKQIYSKQIKKSYVLLKSLSSYCFPLDCDLSFRYQKSHNT